MNPLGILQTPGAQADLEKLTEQTLNLFKDSIQTGWTPAQGLYQYGLENVAKLIYPLVTPFRNSVKRSKAAVGAGAARWKAIVGFGYTKQLPTQAFTYAGAQVETVEQDFVAPYQLLSLGDTVSMDAQTMARGYDNLRAKAGIKVLYELMTGEDVIALGGQAFALQAPGAPTLTNKSTGGTIGTGTWKIGVAVGTIESYWYGGSATQAMMTAVAAGQETSTTLASGTTNSIEATVTAVSGAAVYYWFDDGGTGGALKFNGSSTVNSYTITAAGTGFDAPATDTSADANAFNGYLATLTGDYTNGGLVQRGTGTRSSGATFVSLNGATLTANNGTIQEIDNVLLTLSQTLKISPTRLIMNPQEAFNISDKMFSSGGFRIMLQAKDRRDQGIGGLYLEDYINKAFNGQAIKMVVDPQVPPGTILGVCDVLPYPDNTIDSVLEIETQQDYQQIEYAMSRGTGANGGPRYDFEVRTIETLKNYFPAGGVVISNIANG